jgi:hypothetical protein
VRPIGAEGSEVVIFQKQLGLLLWKSFIEKSRQRKTIGLYFGIPVLVLLACWLIYGTFNDWTSSGVVSGVYRVCFRGEWHRVAINN